MFIPKTRLPTRVLDKEFHMLTEVLENESVELMEKWYKLDMNSSKLEFLLHTSRQLININAYNNSKFQIFMCYNQLVPYIKTLQTNYKNNSKRKIRVLGGVP